MNAEELKRWSESDNGVVLDVRLGNAYAEGHIAGAMSAPYRQQGWAKMVAAWWQQQGAALDVVLFGDNPVVVRAAQSALAAEGLVAVGVFDQGLAPWRASGYPVVAVKAVTVDELASHRDQWTVIDVREPFEHRSGIIPGARKIPMGDLEKLAPQLPKDGRYAIVCASGNRSQTAAAHLAEKGFEVANVVGGMSLWMGGGHPVDRS